MAVMESKNWTKPSLYKHAILVCDILKGGNSQNIPTFVLPLSGNKSTHAPVLYLQLTGAYCFPIGFHQITGILLS